ncbi:MAG: undecaprenyldiphospho-muramoylpentapeptide beta-N-acetylglucosaminyltransferase [Gemmatimonadales bacterium]
MSPVVLIAGGGTGGHLMPALAIADAVARERGFEPVLVGAERGVEARILPTRPYRHYLLPSQPLYRHQWWKNLRSPVAGWRVCRGVRALLEAERPAVAIGTGGYASAPVLWFAARRGIPIALQEQNAWPGLATRWLAKRARHVYLGLPEARTRIRVGPETEVFDTGNPIMPPDPSRRPRARELFGLRSEAPVLLIMGGSQGALAVNRVVAEWLGAGGGSGLQVIWAAGPRSYDEFRRFHAPPDVQVVEFLDPIADAYAVADLVVARAGALTIAELCAWGLPSILIPLPSAAADHQTFNARAMADSGAARLLPQAELTPDQLGREVTALLSDDVRRNAMANRAGQRGRPDAAAQIVSRLLTLLPAPQSFATQGKIVN